MRQRLISTAITTSFLLANTPIALAQQADIFNPHANFGQSSEVSASLYARVPFNGGLKRSSNEEARFGLAVRARLPQKFSYAPASYGYSPTTNFGPQVNVLDLSIGYSFHESGGFQGFKLNGHSLNEWNALHADDEEEGDGDGGMSTGTKVALGVGAAAVTLILVSVLVVCTDDDPNRFHTC